MFSKRASIGRGEENFNSELLEKYPMNMSDYLCIGMSMSVNAVLCGSQIWERLKTMHSDVISLPQDLSIFGGSSLVMNMMMEEYDNSFFSIPDELIIEMQKSLQIKSYLPFYSPMESLTTLPMVGICKSMYYTERLINSNVKINIGQLLSTNYSWEFCFKQPLKSIWNFLIEKTTEQSNTLMKPAKLPGILDKAVLKKVMEEQRYLLLALVSIGAGGVAFCIYKRYKTHEKEVEQSKSTWNHEFESCAG